MEPSTKKYKASCGGGSSKRPPTPLSLYKQALKLVRSQPCGDTSADGPIADKLRQVIAALAAANGATQQTVEHSLDLELSDEPAFLLASAHLQLGLLLQRQDALAPAAEQLEHSLRCFPRFAAAHAALGQVLKSSAASPSELQRAEHHLRQALEVAAQLQARDGGLLVESNRACAAELEAADAARPALAMLLCQASRDGEAAPLLQELGFKFRLSREVLHYALPSTDAGQQQQQPAAAAGAAAASVPAGSCGAGSDDDGSSSRHLQVVDNALPAGLLSHLQAAFAPGAPFWRQHNYGRVGYFSYFFPLDEPACSSMHQLAGHLQALAARYFPAVAEARYAEFWAHCRRHASGHQLHFDSDDEGQGGVRNPIISCVLYLSPNTSSGSKGGSKGSGDDALQQQQQQQQAECGDGAPAGCGDGSCGGLQQQAGFVGGPTLVTDQQLGGPLATRGWLAYPAVNRLTMFDGRYLHGVVPGRGAAAADARRCTLMVAFWRGLKCRTPPGSAVPGACMPMPGADASSSSEWHRMLLPQAGGWGGCQEMPVPAPLPVSAVWQATSGPAGPSTAGAAYDACFQGF